MVRICRLEECIIKNIVQKVIRSVELKGNQSNNIIKYIENDKNVTKYKHTVNDSELIRAIETIDKQYTYTEQYGKRELIYIEGLISVNVGYGVQKYDQCKKEDGILILQHWKWINENEDKKDSEGNDLPPKFKLIQCFDENNNPIVERFKRVIVGSGHTRGKKALFVREDLFEKIDKILLGGINEYAEINGYPKYKKGYAKWNSYYGLPSTDSKVVSYVPKIVVIKDFKRNVEDTFDTVIQTKKYAKKPNPDWIEGDDEKDKYIDDKDKVVKEYDVKNNDKRQYNPEVGGIMPFDGAGLVSVECAKKWADELDIRNKYKKRYIPAAFQIRAIPGIKGNLYTFDIKQFAEENGWIITDIKNKKHNLEEEMIDIILTESQAKFINLFDNDIDKWKEIFDKPVVFYKKDENDRDTEEIECSYKRTFNISEYSEDVYDLKKKMFSAYQHLLTVDYTDDEIETYAEDTVKMLEAISCDVNEFLKFRSCTDEEEQNNKTEWKRIPPYYRAAYYASDENKPIIFADDYFKCKVQDDIRGIKNRAMSGKLYITGNYQVLTPDIYALAQFAFGKRGDEVTGLLKSEEIYAYWWIYQNEKASKKEVDKEEFLCDKLALIRNPHIYMEARTAIMASDKDKADKARYELIKKWYKYQTTGIITDSYSTIPLALGTADFDGDHIATTNSKEYVQAVERARKDGKGNTIDVQYRDLTEIDKSTNKEIANVQNIDKLMEFDILAYQNNIGSVIDRVTNLWGIDAEKLIKEKYEKLSKEQRDKISTEEISKEIEEEHEKIQKYIKIMDIVGQLTIDAAKTGEFEPIPKDIELFLKDEKIKKPYFMKYLPKNEQRSKAEKAGIENAKNFYEGQDNIIKNQLKFSDSNISLNRICHHMETKTEGIDNKISGNIFDLDKFLKIFVTEKPNETSNLYIEIRKRLYELSGESASVYKQLVDYDDSDERKEERMSHYKYFYIYARNELLKICKLSEEKSVNKVLNCIVYMCYREPEFMDNDCAKNILWNCFEKEMIMRSKGNYTDSTLDFSTIVLKAERTKELKKRKLAKYQKERKFSIAEFENKDKRYSQIIIRDEDIKLIHNTISDENLNECGISANHTTELKKLYAVLMVLSKRIESDRPVGKNKQICHIINSLTIYDNKNNGLNFSNIAKLCGYTDYQRKNMKTRLKELHDLGAIVVSPTKINNIRFRVIYEKIAPESYNMSLVNMNDYKQACKDILKRL